MKLLRYGPSGQEKPGLLDSAGAIRDLSGVVADLAGDTLLPESLAKLRALDVIGLEPDAMRDIRWRNAMRLFPKGSFPSVERFPGGTR